MPDPVRKNMQPLYKGTVGACRALIRGTRGSVIEL